jgi:hypothetical protein
MELKRIKRAGHEFRVFEDSHCPPSCVVLLDRRPDKYSVILRYTDGVMWKVRDGEFEVVSCGPVPAD